MSDQLPEPTHPLLTVLLTGVLPGSTQHSIIIKPVGTKNASSSSTAVDVDAFVARR